MKAGKLEENMFAGKKYGRREGQENWGEVNEGHLPEKIPGKTISAVRTTSQEKNKNRVENNKVINIK